MASTKWNQEINAGENWEASLILSSSTTGLARDLTGITIESKVKRHYKSVNPKETINVAVTSATEGAITMSLTNVQTTNLRSGKYLYDVELTDGSTGEKERVIEGVINIRPEVTT